MMDDSASLCWQIDIKKVILFISSYILLCWVYEKNNKHQVLVSNIISCIACWRCLLYHDLSELISYYWYDLMLMTIKKDWLMILHHVFTIYGISHCPNYEDYDKIMSILWACKLSDVVVHQYHIAQASNLIEHYPIAIKIYQIVTIIYTCVAWFMLRIVFIMSLFPFYSAKANILIPIFVSVNLYWIIKRMKLAMKIASAIKNDIMEN